MEETKVGPGTENSNILRRVRENISIKQERNAFKNNFRHEKLKRRARI